MTKNFKRMQFNLEGMAVAYLLKSKIIQWEQEL